MSRVILKDFPDGLRGTYLLYARSGTTFKEYMTFIKEILNRRALTNQTPVLLSLEDALKDGLFDDAIWIMWWPAAEPKHNKTDIILDGTKDSLRLATT